MLITKYHLG